MSVMCAANCSAEASAHARTGKDAFNFVQKLDAMAANQTFVRSLDGGKKVTLGYAVLEPEADAKDRFPLLILPDIAMVLDALRTHTRSSAHHADR